MEAEAQEDQDSLGTTIQIRYDGEAAHRIENTKLVASRSEYFSSLFERWWNHDSRPDTHDVPVIESIGILSVQTVLEVLDGEELTPTKLQGGRGDGPLDDGIICLSYYLGCDDFVLPLYCTAAQPGQRRSTAWNLCKKDQFHELEKLLATSGFFCGFDKTMVPLFQEFCVTRSIAILLLSAYNDAPDRTYGQSARAAIGAVLGGAVYGLLVVSKTEEPATITAQDFSILTIQKFASAEWSRDTIELVFSLLPASRSGYEKPDGVEILVSKALLFQLSIPEVLRHWDLEPELVGPALCNAGRLDEAPNFSNAQDHVREVVRSWTPSECAKNLKENRGGLRRLLDALDDENCQWLADIPVFYEACCHAEGALQRLLFRRLFLYTGFDPRLPSALLTSSLPLGRDPQIRRRALGRAVEYLEHNDRSVETLDLPWEEADKPMTERVAALIGDQSEIWSSLDISKLHGRFLDYVPAKILARHAYEEARSARNDTKKLRQRVQSLERDVDQLEDKVRGLERELKRR